MYILFEYLATTVITEIEEITEVEETVTQIGKTVSWILNVDYFCRHI